MRLCIKTFKKKESKVKIVIVGGGVAGLVCGRSLQRAGHEVVLLEGSDGVGGRVRSDKKDGFTLERGFQVLFTAYPAARRQLEYSRLDFRMFNPGAIISQNGKRHVLSDPLRDPPALFPAALTNIVSPLDKVRTLFLVGELTRKTIHEIISGPDETTEHYLQQRHFSPKFINNFVRPFYGGIFLDNSLHTSAKAFKYDFKMLSVGQTVVPAGGMGQISAQLAEELQATNSVRLNSRVVNLVKGENGHWTGAQLESGEKITGDAVVVATPAPEAARLTNQPMPPGQTSTVNLYWAGSSPLYQGKKIVLNANPNPFINNTVLATNIAPEYAPPGQHLLSATILGQPQGSDDDLFARGLTDLRRIFRGDPHAEVALTGYRPLAIYRIPYGQFAQPPGVHLSLPDNESGQPGLFFASEFTEASSLNAAMVSGEKAAALILQTAGPIAYNRLQKY